MLNTNTEDKRELKYLNAIKNLILHNIPSNVREGWVLDYIEDTLVGIRCLNPISLSGIDNIHIGYQLLSKKCKLPKIPLNQEYPEVYYGNLTLSATMFQTNEAGGCKELRNNNINRVPRGLSSNSKLDWYYTFEGSIKNLLPEYINLGYTPSFLDANSRAELKIFFKLNGKEIPFYVTFVFKKEDPVSEENFDVDSLKEACTEIDNMVLLEEKAEALSELRKKLSRYENHLESMIGKKSPTEEDPYKVNFPVEEDFVHIIKKVADSGTDLSQYKSMPELLADVFHSPLTPNDDPSESEAVPKISFNAQFSSGDIKTVGSVKDYIQQVRDSKPNDITYTPGSVKLAHVYESNVGPGAKVIKQTFKDNKSTVGDITSEDKKAPKMSEGVHVLEGFVINNKDDSIIEKILKKKCEQYGEVATYFVYNMPHEASDLYELPTPKHDGLLSALTCEEYRIKISTRILSYFKDVPYIKVTYSQKPGVLFEITGPKLILDDVASIEHSLLFKSPL